MPDERGAGASPGLPEEPTGRSIFLCPDEGVSYPVGGFGRDVGVPLTAVRPTTVK